MSPSVGVEGHGRSRLGRRQEKQQETLGLRTRKTLEDRGTESSTVCGSPFGPVSQGRRRTLWRVTVSSGEGRVKIENRKTLLSNKMKTKIAQNQNFSTGDRVEETYGPRRDVVLQSEVVVRRVHSLPPARCTRSPCRRRCLPLCPTSTSPTRSECPSS